MTPVLPSDSPASHSVSPLINTFFQQFGQANPRVFYAPGRVNLIGEHTDYNHGFVLPMAINRGTFVLAAVNHSTLAEQPELTVYAANVQEKVTVKLGDTPPPEGHWTSYVAGMLAKLHQDGVAIPNANLLIYGDIPIGSGLSSSASLECAIGYALLSLAGQTVIDKTQLALTGQWAEHHYAGTQCGIMDQLVVALAQADHALLIDCLDLSTQLIPFLLPADVTLLISDTRVSHSLASSAYNQRRQQCADGLALIKQHYPKVMTYRDITPAIYTDSQALFAQHPLLWQRVRHVVTENNRVQHAVTALTNNQFEPFGQLMNQSHQSLKMDYQVSCPELDYLAETAQGLEDVYGARMTGGGFGGCTIALVKTTALDEVIHTLTQGYLHQFGQKPGFYFTTACAGVEECANDNRVSVK